MRSSVAIALSGLLATAGCARPHVAARPTTPPPVATARVEAAPAVPPSAEERKILSAIDGTTTVDMELLERAVNINSGTMNFDGVRAVGAIFREELDRLGFTTRWVPMVEAKRAGHLIAERRGHGTRALLIGHLDTVFERESPFQRFVREGDTASGPGVLDMKGGLVVMVSALRALEHSGSLADTNITIVLHGDEEKPGQPESISRRDLIEAGRRSDVALCFENTVRENGRDLGTVGRRGSTEWTLRVTGKGGHSGLIFSDRLGSGAIFEAGRIVDTFYRELHEPNMTFSVGLVLGGTQVELDPSLDGGLATGKANVVPERAIARGDLRALTPEQVVRTKEKMQAIVGRHLPRTEATIEFQDGYPPMAPTAGNRALLERLNDVNRTLGEPPEGEADPMMRGAGDIAFVAPFASSLSGLGMTGRGAHAPGETADLSRMTLLTKRTALFLYRLTR